MSAAVVRVASVMLATSVEDKDVQPRGVDVADQILLRWERNGELEVESRGEGVSYDSTAPTLVCSCSCIVSIITCALVFISIIIVFELAHDERVWPIEHEETAVCRFLFDIVD